MSIDPNGVREGATRGPQQFRKVCRVHVVASEGLSRGSAVESATRFIVYRAGQSGFWMIGEAKGPVNPRLSSCYEYGPKF